ncbi:MAG: hypothetical protein K2J26_08585, partial [Ruminococcus sp.]|nr:hypothetical protein [Ruminococcus sp.]
GFKINADWRGSQAPENYLEYFNSSGLDGEIVYEGGGNLCIIYKDYETYVKVNRVLSKKILEKAFGISIIASYTQVTDDFVNDRKKLYIENATQKNLGSYHTPCNVLPFTQVDRLTYQPIVEKENNTQYTTESLKKSEKYNLIYIDESVIEKEFDKMVDKGNDSLLAIIYIDGNNMGNKIKQITENKNDYSSGINALREFSKTTNNDFVSKPIRAITEMLENLYAMNEGNPKQQQKYLFRPIIQGGDEITIVCNAHTVPEIIETYFSTLTAESKNSSCAGIAVFHSHAPFADVYRIAEQCCESGKEISHLPENGDKNYIDFHFCHAGITNSLEVIRKTQEEDYTARPYEYKTTWQEFMKYGNLLSQIKRADIKALGEAIVNGDSYYREELARIKSRDKENKIAEIYNHADEVKKYIFDISIIFDLWFTDKEQV